MLQRFELLDRTGTHTEGEVTHTYKTGPFNSELPLVTMFPGKFRCLGIAEEAKVAEIGQDMTESFGILAKGHTIIKDGKLWSAVKDGETAFSGTKPALSEWLEQLDARE